MKRNYSQKKSMVREMDCEPNTYGFKHVILPFDIFWREG